MNVNPKKKDEANKISEITCPNCNAKVDLEDVGMVMFESATIFSCPICKKTIAIQPKGNEFEIKSVED